MAPPHPYKTLEKFPPRKTFQAPTFTRRLFQSYDAWLGALSLKLKANSRAHTKSDAPFNLYKWINSGQTFEVKGVLLECLGCGNQIQEFHQHKRPEEDKCHIVLRYEQYIEDGGRCIVEFQVKFQEEMRDLEPLYDEKLWIYGEEAATLSFRDQDANGREYELIMEETMGVIKCCRCKNTIKMIHQARKYDDEDSFSWHVVPEQKGFYSCRALGL